MFFQKYLMLRSNTLSIMWYEGDFEMGAMNLALRSLYLDLPLVSD